MHSAGTTCFSENYFKAMFLLQLVSVLLINVTLNMYLANIIFGMTWQLTIAQHTQYKY